MIGIYKDYLKETVDGKGIITDAHIEYPDDFNFAYEVVDRIASVEPDRRALQWCSVTGAERMFTFGDIKRLSDKTANYLSSMGITKGTRVSIIAEGPDEEERVKALTDMLVKEVF